jgi:DNA polymerase-3 subunit alpha
MFAPRKEEKEEYPDIDEFPEKELIAFEKETIGFYISRHPLLHYQEEIRRVTVDDTTTLSTRYNGAEVKVCGLINGWKEITTKKGDRMAFLTLEDLKGFVEVILFPEVFKSALPLLGGGDPVLVRGILDLSEEQVKIKASEVLPLAEVASRAAKTIHLRIPIASAVPSQLTDLREIIISHPGGARVHLHLTDEKLQETVIAFGDQFRVNPSPEVQSRIENLFGSSQMTLE